MDLQMLTQYEKQHLEDRQRLPDRYIGLSDEEMDVRIMGARAVLGERLVILGHHYQRDEVIKFADYVGDSFNLARYAANHSKAEFIVFCGVHFMAESADVLSDEYQQVILPDLAAGCSMADMAAADQLELCWRELEQMGIAGVVPVTYMNSSAAVKAFCGERDGVVCTSSNAKATFRWAWDRGRQILFLPDEHLGRNTAYGMGVPLDEMVVWNPDEVWGGLTPDRVNRARMILWKGHCSVHIRFNTQQIEKIRKDHPEARIVVHPECTWDVVQAADDSGSTEHIVERIKTSSPGSVWAVGTEVHLVNRLARALAPDKTVMTLDPFGCLCSTMFRVSPNHLLWVLEGLLEDEVYNRIIVPVQEKYWVRVALNRMLLIH